MIPISLPGIPNDENSSALRGPAEAPERTRRDVKAAAHRRVRRGADQFGSELVATIGDCMRVTALSVIAT